jgi:membrane associated rhomboid family serine protease
VIPLPLRDDNPTERTPVVTILIIAANVLFWLYQLSLAAQSKFGLLETSCDFGLVPSFLLHGVSKGTLQVSRYGIECQQNVPYPWTLLTSMFTHGGWMHIIGNMWFLWIFGDNIEDAVGHFRFIVFYLLCGLAAAGAQIAADPGSTVPMVGASGAIAGVLGGYALLYPRARVRCLWFLFIFITTIDVPAWLLLGLWFVSQFFVARGSGIAWMAHVGGFLAGLGLVRLFLIGRPLRPRRVHWDDGRGYN